MGLRICLGRQPMTGVEWKTTTLLQRFGGWQFVGLNRLRDLSFIEGKQLAMTIKADQVLVYFSALLLFFLLISYIPP